MAFFGGEFGYVSLSFRLLWEGWSVEVGRQLNDGIDGDEILCDGWCTLTR